MRMSILPDFTYVGSLNFILHGVAKAEQHHFVVADKQRHVQRLLWVQFEAYLDNNDYAYRYRIQDTLTLAGYIFLHDSDILNIDDDYQERPSSDSAHVVDFLKEKGFVLDGDTMFKRLVWLAPGKRKEMMIIYSEDLRPAGYRLADLTEGGSAAADWPALAQGLHERALASFTVSL